MNKRELFIQWMKKNASLSLNTIYKYARAISINSEELNRHKVLVGSLYDISDSTLIDNMKVKYLSIPELKEKDTRGNRMYSSALKYYKKFLEDYHEQETIEDEISKQDAKYDKEFLSLLEENDNEIRIISDNAEDKPGYKTINNYRLWIRNPKLAADVVSMANFLCEINNDHKHFNSKFNNKNYVEAHHLIPMQYQGEFEFSLDVYANIVSLCLVCHKLLHYGAFNEKKEIIYNLFSSRIDRLAKSGVLISLDKLYEYYKD